MQNQSLILSPNVLVIKTGFGDDDDDDTISTPSRRINMAYILGVIDALYVVVL